MKWKSRLDFAASISPAITPSGPGSTIGDLNRQGMMALVRRYSRDGIAKSSVHLRPRRVLRSSTSAMKSLQTPPSLILIFCTFSLEVICIAAIASWVCVIARFE
ncbi:hypothetical protein NL676_010911 [Syzygium grande]|nr:hypothetical protein NL676_010911 [Syzygium grande]